MLGNDVVDLADVDARPETFRRRFDARVFSDDELREIAEDEDPQACRWAHWGAKEATYKLARQIDPGFVFSPGRLVARYESRDGGAARSPMAHRERRGRLELSPGPRGAASGFELRDIELRSDERREWVHVVAQPAGSDWSRVARAVEAIDGPGEDPGLAVRRLARQEIARALGVDAGRLAIGRENRIPTLELDGRRLALALSLSHHGRFVAYAVALTGSCIDAPWAARTEGDEDGADGAGGREVVQSSGFVGYPLGFADTAWMTG